MDIFADFSFENLNDSVSQSVFPSALKLANLPISILSNVSKIYERFFLKQISEYFEQFLSKYQCGFRKVFSAQNSLLRNGNQMLITKKLFGALLTDLSKTFGCLSHNLLIAKLNDHGFSMTVLRLIQSYLSNRKQRTKINTDNSSWEENVFGQSSILGPLLFNILLYGLFLIITNIELAGYTDDNTSYAIGSNIEELIVYYKTTQKHCFNGKVITKWN